MGCERVCGLSKVGNVWAVHLHNQWDKGFPRGGWVDEMILKPVTLFLSSSTFYGFEGPDAGATRNMGCERVCGLHWEDVRSKVGNVWAVHLHNQWDKGFPRGGWVDEMTRGSVGEAVREDLERLVAVRDDGPPHLVVQARSPIDPHRLPLRLFS
jgi:hypothetical protein